MTGGQTAQNLEASKPINYRWTASLKSYLCDLCEVMEHMTTKGLTLEMNHAFKWGYEMEGHHGNTDK